LVIAYEADVARVQTSLGQQAFTMMREAGRAAALEELVAEAVTFADELMGEAKVL
jgi:hypothetical protein